MLDAAYNLHGHTLEVVSSVKYLGLTISKDLKWEQHINMICTKANRTLAFLRRNITVASIAIKERAYKALVRPLVEYASAVWDPYLKQDINKLEMVQRRAARYVTNRTRNTSSVTDMLNRLNWRSLEDRRRDSRLCALYKSTNGKLALETQGKLVPPTRRSRNTHDRSFQVPHCRIESRRMSFYLRTIRDWNGLPQDFVHATSPDTFRDKVSHYSA